MEKDLKSIKVNIFYDEELKKITGKKCEEVIVSENLNFIQLLNFIFSSYPEIPKRFIPGTLGFLLNGKEPKENDILKNDDKIEILVLKIEDIRKRIEFQLREIINYYQIDATFEEIKEMVFNENGQEDFNKLIGLFVSKINSGNLDEINEVLKFVNAVWNYFPHKSLKGLSPIEKLNR
ncbi:hypothetical protein J7K86_02435 [bacterium]|nr:hypothetical protein [bacterium]